MKICRFVRSDSQETHLGVLDSTRNQVVDLTSLDSQRFSSFSSLVGDGDRGSSDITSKINSKLESSANKVQTIPLDQVRLVVPLLPPEVWAAGVTYVRSRQAREVETSLKGLYSHVYDARRPEVFFKTTGHRCVGPNEDVGIRGDSKWSVPEPELTAVLGNGCEVVGYTIGNDMSARDIEGENPLYLPQAKIFRNCCALGPVITTTDEIGDARRLEIDMSILRGGRTVFQGSISTSQMKRTIEELVGFLKAYNEIPPASVFLTGTGIVPPDDFTLIDKDVIEIRIEKIGKLTNPVTVLS
jgi:2-dehydro-3-deoxy-D-arabinonate dehydratase